MADFSIIMCVYNNETTVQSAIDSFFEQKNKSAELLILEGRSTDNSLNVIQQHLDENYRSERKRWKLVSEADRGLYDALNKGISMSEGKYIGVLHADDFYASSESIPFLTDELIKHNLLIGNAAFIDGVGRIIRYHDSLKHKAWQFRFGMMPSHTAAFIKTTVFKEIGSYSLHYQIASDFDLYIRMFTSNKWNPIYLNQLIVKMRYGGLSTSGLGSKRKLNQELIDILKENKITSSRFLILFRYLLKLRQYVT